jgi:hypothetical protein
MEYTYMSPFNVTVFYYDGFYSESFKTMLSEFLEYEFVIFNSFFS